MEPIISKLSHYKKVSILLEETWHRRLHSQSVLGRTATIIFNSCTHSSSRMHRSLWTRGCIVPARECVSLECGEQGIYCANSRSSQLFKPPANDPYPSRLSACSHPLKLRSPARAHTLCIFFRGAKRTSKDSRDIRHLRLSMLIFTQLYPHRVVCTL